LAAASPELSQYKALRTNYMEKQPLLERIKKLSSPLKPKRFPHEIHLEKLDDIQCVALDFYGTMFISGVGDIGIDEPQKTANKRHFAGALTQLGFERSPDSPAAKTGLLQFQRLIEEYVKRKKVETDIEYPEPDIIGVWEGVLAFLEQHDLINGPVSRGQAIRLAVEFEFRAYTIWPAPNLAIVLKEILKRGCKLGIISNSQFYTPLAFEALIGQTTDDFGFEPELQKWSYVNGVKKPSLQFYREFVDELPAEGLAPENVLYVGNDLFKDMLPAKNLGMKTALYAGDRRSIRHENEDLVKLENRPDIIINELEQILECLG
jgi:putative hydrolase of the HAD superfamily